MIEVVPEGRYFGIPQLQVQNLFDVLSELTDTDCRRGCEGVGVFQLDLPIVSRDRCALDDQFGAELTFNLIQELVARSPEVVDFQNLSHPESLHHWPLAGVRVAGRHCPSSPGVGHATAQESRAESASGQLLTAALLCGRLSFPDKAADF